jgi:hypothetical protein
MVEGWAATIEAQARNNPDNNDLQKFIMLI